VPGQGCSASAATEAGQAARRERRKAATASGNSAAGTPCADACSATLVRVTCQRVRVWRVCARVSAAK